jgi:putative protein-disulfide isomerase
MSDSKYSIIYVYDALCGWCYGFSSVMHEIFQKYQSQFNFEVISGGMILRESAGRISKMAPFIKNNYKDVENTTGVVFGESFLKALDKGEIFFSSEKPAIALSVFKSFYPEKALLFAEVLQRAIYVNGLDLSIDENYISLLTQFNITEEDFLKKLNQEEFKQAAYYDFALARQLHVTGYPAVFIRTGELQFYMIAKGYTDLASLELRIQNILKEVLV